MSLECHCFPAVPVIQLLFSWIEVWPTISDYKNINAGNITFAFSIFELY